MDVKRCYTTMLKASQNKNVLTAAVSFY